MQRITRRRAMAWLGALVLVVAGCSTGRGARRADPPTYVIVQNQSWLDQTIYVMRSSQRMRLGTVSGTSRQRLRIPASLLFGPTPLRFIADPIGSDRQAASMEVVVTPGEDVFLTIP